MNDLLTKHVRTGDRCFYFNKMQGGTLKIFRANFFEIINQSLIVTKYAKLRCELDDSLKYSIPLNWITRVITLDDVIGKKLKLPREILDIIDSYLL